MSRAIFNVLREALGDPSIPVMNALPSIAVLQEVAWDCPFVFRYEPHPAKDSADSTGSTRSASTPPSSACADREYTSSLAAITDSNWPSTLQGWRMCAMSRTTLHRVMDCAEDGQPSTTAEIIHTTLLEVVGTVFAVERYQTFTRPLEGGAAAAGGACAAATTALGGAAKPGAVMSLSDSLALEYLKQARAGAVVCRVVSTAGGMPPSPPVAMANLLRGLDGVLRNTFFRSATFLLGVTPKERERCWQHAILTSSDAGLTDHSSLTASHSRLPSTRTPSNARDTPSKVHMSALEDHTPMASLAEHTPPSPFLATSAALPPFAHLTPEEAARCSEHTCWQSMALPSLFENYYYNTTVIDGWRRWTTACNGGICRAFIVNSVDDIVHYGNCSRNAFYAAVAYLDRFVALTVNPVQSCRQFLARIHTPARRSHGGDQLSRRESTSVPTVDSNAMCTFFMQVIAACAMLGCKNTDTYPPPVSKVLLCLQAQIRLSVSQFALLEMLLLETLDFAIQPVTVNQVVDTLLYMGGGDGYQEALDRVHYGRVRGTSGLKEDEACLSAAHALGGSSKRAAGLPADTIKDWQRFSYLARFLSDLVIRGNKDTVASSQLLAVPPAVTGVAIIAVTAEILSVALPEALFNALPTFYQTHLRELHLAPCGDGGAGRDNEESVGFRSPLAAPGTFLVRAGDQTNVLLKQFALLFASCTATGDAQRLSSLMYAELCISYEVGGTLEGDAELFEVAINETRACHERCRETPCDPILRKRYREMLSLKA